jgi:hypothetical protein
MFSFLYKKLELLFVAILGAFCLFLLGRNDNLTKMNEELNKAYVSQKKTIEVQKKVLHVEKTLKPTNIDGNLKRMRSGTL